MTKQLHECSVCGKVGFKSGAALKAHQKAMHATEGHQGPAFRAAPGTPPGYHQTECPTCKQHTVIYIKEDGTIASSSEIPQPPSSSQTGIRKRHIRRGALHEVVRARFKMRWNKEESRWKRTVVMSGTHGRSAVEIPWREPGVKETWLLNDSHGIAYIDPHVKAGHVDRWWQLHHRWRFTRRQTRYASDHWQWLQDVKTVPRIVMQRKFKEIPHSEGYPFREVCEMFLGGKLGRGAGHVQYYFTNTFSYMFAQVLYEKVKGIYDWERIELYGCELEQLETEYFRQRPGLEFWFGMAVAHGVEIYVPESTYMLYAQDVQKTQEGPRMVQYPGYMAYGLLSPSMMEAKAEQQPLGVDPIEESVIGSWDDYPYIHHTYAINDAMARQQQLHWLGGEKARQAALNEWIDKVAA